MIRKTLICIILALGCVGCFLSACYHEVRPKETVKPAIEPETETFSMLREAIVVKEEEGTEFFSYIQEQVKDEGMTRAEEDLIQYFLDGDFSLSQLVRVDVSNERHLLFMQWRGNIYQWAEDCSMPEWNEKVKQLLTEDLLVQEGKTVTYNPMILTGQMQMKENTDDGVDIWLLYGKGQLRLSSFDISQCKKENDTITIVKGKEEHTSTLTISKKDEQAFETGAEALEYYKRQHPDFMSYRLLGQRNGKEFSIEMNEPEESIYYMQTLEETYVMHEEINGYWSVLKEVEPSLSYRKEEDGSGFFYKDNEEKTMFYEKKIGQGVVICCDIRILGGDDFESNYELNIYLKDKEDAIQRVVYSSAEGGTIVFEDLNSDGYLDITLLLYYGANGGTSEHYIWSPSNEKFVKGPSEIEYFGWYWMEPEERLLGIHTHGSAISGTEYLYQWEDETELKLRKYFSHDTVDQNWDEVDIIIERYDPEKIILSDYRYSVEEYEARLEEIWGTYNEDFLWERTVTPGYQTPKIVLRYAEGGLYIYREDTYLIQVLKQNSDSTYDTIKMIDKNEDGLLDVVIRYKSGDEKCYIYSVSKGEYEAEI